MDCGIEIKFRIAKQEDGQQLTPEYLEEIKRFLIFKERLQSKISGSGTDKRQDLVEKISMADKFQKRVEQVYCGSIFIAMSCPDEESMEDLRQKLDSGELREVLMDAFEIEKLQKQYQLNSLEVVISLRELRKLPPRGSYSLTILIESYYLITFTNLQILFIVYCLIDRS